MAGFLRKKVDAKAIAARIAKVPCARHDPHVVLLNAGFFTLERARDARCANTRRKPGG